VQAVGELVQLIKARGHTRHSFAAVSGGLDLVNRGFHDVLEDNVVLGGAALSDGIDLGLGLIDQILHLAVGTIAQLNDLGAGIDQPAQDSALGHDLGVVSGIGGRRYGLNEFVQVGGS